MTAYRRIPQDIDLAERARFFRVCERTVRRWIDAGADVHSLESVGTLLLRQRNPKFETLEILTENTDEHI